MKTTKTISFILSTLALSYLFLYVFIFEKPKNVSKNQIDFEEVKSKLFFEPNHGQANNDIKFISNGRTYKLLLKDNAVLLVVNSSSRDRNRGADYIQLKLKGANKAKQITGQNIMTGKTNYLIGNNPEKWVTNIPNYAEVFYEDIYPGIDMVFYGNDGILEYDFIVAPEGNPNDIIIEFESEKKPKIDRNGNLVFNLYGAEIRVNAPITFQFNNGKQKTIKSEFSYLNEKQIGFKIGKYNSNIPLIIDPQILFSTYLGNNSEASGIDIAVDQSEDIYITGKTGAYHFPVTDSSLIPWPSYSRPDVFVTKMKSDGSELLYSTFFGGISLDMPWSIAVDNDGNIFVSGRTHSKDFPTKNAVDPIFQGDIDENHGDGDGFIVKLNPEGDELVFSTFLGGKWDDEIRDLVIDQSGNAIVTGFTQSEDFPIKNAIKPTKEDNMYDEVFLTKFNTLGEIIFSTFLSADYDAVAYGIDLDKDDNIYITGNSSPGFPKVGSAGMLESYSGFVAKIKSDGTDLIYLKELGFNYGEEIGAIAVDSLGNAHIAGTGLPDNLVTVNAFQPTSGGFYDGFVAKLSSDGSTIDFATHIGGESHDMVSDIALDLSGNIYISGFTRSTNFPVQDEFYSTLNGYNDAFIAMIEAENYTLKFSTYLGGDNWELSEKQGIAVSCRNYVYLTGKSNSTDFPTENALQSDMTAQYDAYVVKLVVVEKGILSVKPERLIFPYTEPGKSSKKSIELTNSGFGLLEVKKITVEPSDVYSLEEAPNLPYKLESEQNIEFEVVYSPGTQKSTKNASDEGGATLKIETDGLDPVTEVPIINAIIINDTTDASDIPDDNICDIDLSKDGYQVSLRAAIEFVNSLENAEITNITFDIPIEKVPVIYPLSALDPIEYPISLDASTQSKGYAIVDGSKAGANIEGLVIKAGSSKIKDLNIINFGANGIQLCEKDSNIIDNCEIFGNGMSASEPKRSNGLVINNSSKNKITKSVISNNKGNGIVLTGSSPIEKNIIENNNIGTSILGLYPFPNRRNGVAIETCVSKTTINDNLISGNNGYGISIINTSRFYEEEDKTKENTITNNIIGINMFGTDTLSNKSGGIKLSGIGVLENTISANIIAGNVNDGIDIINNSTNNYIVGNMIGLALEDNTAIGNSGHGILLDNVQDNTIDTNIIVNNNGYGIYISNNDPRVNIVKSNYIGRVSKNYNHDIPHKNLWGGIYIEKGAPTISNNLVYDHDTSGIHIVNASAFVQFNKIRYNKTGIEILTESENFNTINKNDITENGTGIRVARVEISNESKSSSLKSIKELRFLGTKYATEDESYNTIINGNSIYKNVDENTGIHIGNTPVFICGNFLDYNEGNAISVSGDENVTVKLNNFYSNEEYGINNNNPVKTIDATNNFWGESTGPGGYGSGTGDEVSDGVDFSDWKTDWIAVYASAERDTFPAVIGITDSVLMVFENWDRETDTLDVLITDELGWIEANSPRQIQTPFYSDEIATLFFTIPEETDNNKFNKVNLRAISQADPNDSAIYNFYIHAQKPALEYLLLFPDTIEVESGSTEQFSVYGYDQTNHLMDFSESWNCTGGIIDDYGLFTAGENIGIYHVVIEDPTSGLSDTAVVYVVSTTQIDIEVANNNKSKKLLHCYPNPFSSSAIVKYELENAGYVTLTVYNSIGQEVDKLVNGFLPTGIYEINWQPKGLETGTYFSKIEISRTKNKPPVYTEVQKMVFVKLE